MKRNKIFAAIAALPLMIASSCTLMEHPDGEGIDPTLVSVEVAVELNLALEDSENAHDALIPQVSADFTRRFVVEVVTPDGTAVDRQTFYTEASTDRLQYTVETRFRLHARQYKLLVWSDYVRTASPEDNLYYDPASLSPVMPQGNYVGNNDRKDCSRACADLDLRRYAKEMSARVSMDVAMTRPVGRYQIVTTDLGQFRKRLADGLISGSEFKARIRYADYRATGYNVLQNVPKNFLSYLFYNVTLKTDVVMGDDASMVLAFDYCLVEPGDEGSQLPLEIEILNQDGKQLSRSILTIPVRQGYNTVVTGRFMTGTDDGSVTVDSEYDGEISIDLGKI